MIILKLGGSVITQKEGYQQANLSIIEGIAKIIGEAWQKDLVLINGAGSFGHAVVKKYNIANGVKTPEEKVGFAEVYRGCNELGNIVSQALIKEGVPAVFIPPLCYVEQDNKKISSAQPEKLWSLVKEGYLPISGGNMVYDKTLGKSIISGDKIIRLLAQSSSEPLVIAFGTDVDGILDNAGKVIPYIDEKTLPQIEPLLRPKEGDYTGAMLGKVREIFQMGKGHIVYIFNLRNLQQLRELLTKKEIKTGSFTKIKL